MDIYVNRIYHLNGYKTADFAQFYNLPFCYISADILSTKAADIFKIYSDPNEYLISRLPSGLFQL